MVALFASLQKGQLIGSLQAACNLGVIKEDLRMSVTVVVSMCETEMNVHGAPSNWNDYFREHNVVHTVFIVSWTTSP